MISVLLVDDHELVRAGLRRALDDVEGFTVIAEADSGEAAVSLCHEKNPDVILMDLRMPNGMDGLATTEKLLQLHPDMKVLVVTALEDHEAYSERSIRAGAFGYISKSASIKEIAKAIKMIHAGTRYISPQLAMKQVSRQIKGYRDSPFELLSTRELQVTMMLIKGTPIQVIAESLGVSSKTVNSYRYRIFEKLKLKSDVDITLLAIRYGLTHPLAEAQLQEEQAINLARAAENRRKNAKATEQADIVIADE